MSVNQVQSNFISNQSITTEKIATSAVNADKIADGSITTGKIADGAVIPGKLSAGHPNWDDSGNTSVSGVLTPSVGTGSKGIVWPSDPGGGSGDAAFIQYYVESGENTRLHIGIRNDADDDIYLDSSQTTVSGNLTVNGTLTGSLNGNAATAYGLNVHTGRNNEANKVVRTDGSGYLQTGYINSSSGNENNNSNPDRVWGTNGSDSYLRTYRTSALSVNYASSSGTSGSCSGNSATATNLSTNRTNWSSNGTISAVVGQLSWKNYGNNHTIFDASQSTSPDGTSVNNTNPEVVWSATYPTLMGWNGSNTYGVRVDSARISDSCSGNAATANTSGSCSGNAATAYGLNVHTGRNNEANKVVRTDGSGYLQTGYINSSSGNENNNSNPDRVWGTNGSDSYLRTYRTSALSVNYASSSGTSGSCSGNAATATTADSCTGNAATATTAASCSGNSATATNLSTNRTNWSSNGTISAVVGQLAWKNYGNGHTIFDASQSTSPDGTSVNNANSEVAWGPQYPTLMGWSGGFTYGVRVDSARAADSAGNLLGGSAGTIAYQSDANVTAFSNKLTFTNPGLNIICDDNNYVFIGGDGGNIELCRTNPQGNETLEPGCPYIDFKRSPGQDWDWRLMAKMDGDNNRFVIRREKSANLECLNVYYDGSVESGIGWIGRAGSEGQTSNVFNIHWTGSNAELWIDNSNLGTISFSSDYRIKKNIKPQTSPAIERISRLNPVTYELQNYGQLFKEDGVQREGFIAHELAEVIPSAVEGEKDDPNQIQSLRLDALVSVLTKALQEAVIRIESLETEVAKLKNK